MTKMLAIPFFVLSLALAGCKPPSQEAARLEQNPISENNPFAPAQALLPVKVSGKWGYINGVGKLVINPRFDWANSFHSGRAAVCVGQPCDYFATSQGNSQWGYIDESSKFVVNPQYAAASDFSEGMASVCMGDCTAMKPTGATRGYIDLTGKEVIPRQFGIAADFKDGLAEVCIGKCGWDNDTGYDGKFGFIDHSGHFVINPIYDNAEDFKDGVAQVKIGRGTESKTGYVNKAGTLIWQPSN
jgi:hypothetical protein